MVEKIMFKEVQIPQSDKLDKNAPLRRWFQGEHAELILWESGDGEILRFRLVSRGLNPEETVTWGEDTGIHHGHIEPGTGAEVTGATPRWVNDFSLPAPQFVSYFQEERKSLPEEIGELVIGKLNCLKGR